MVKGAIEKALVPEFRDTRDEFVSLVQELRDVPTLVRTYGQPATPTVFDEEVAIYTAHLDRAFVRAKVVSGGLAGKLAGASGVYAAYTIVYPGVDWRAFSRKSVGSFGLEYTTLAMQVNPCDDLMALFDAVRGVNNILAGFGRDA